MQNTIINLKTEEKVKKEAQKVAKKKGVSLNTVLNNSLKRFIRTEEVPEEYDETPSQWMIDRLKESEEEEKTGKVTTFYSKKEEFEYLDKLIKNDKRRTSSH